MFSWRVFPAASGKLKITSSAGSAPSGAGTVQLITRMLFFGGSHRHFGSVGAVSPTNVATFGSGGGAFRFVRPCVEVATSDRLPILEKVVLAGGVAGLEAAGAPGAAGGGDPPSLHAVNMTSERLSSTGTIMRLQYMSSRYHPSSSESSGVRVEIAECRV